MQEPCFYFSDDKAEPPNEKAADDGEDIDVVAEESGNDWADLVLGLLNWQLRQRMDQMERGRTGGDDSSPTVVRGGGGVAANFGDNFC